MTGPKWATTIKYPDSQLRWVVGNMIFTYFHNFSDLSYATSMLIGLASLDSWIYCSWGSYNSEWMWLWDHVWIFDSVMYYNVSWKHISNHIISYYILQTYSNVHMPKSLKLSKATNGQQCANKIPWPTGLGSLVWILTPWHHKKNLTPKDV